MIRSLVLAAGFALASVPQAQAVSIIFGSQTVTGSVSPQTLGNTPATYNVSIPSFDPSFGNPTLAPQYWATLTEVFVTVTGYVDGTWQVIRTGGSNIGSANGTVGADFVLRLGATTLVDEFLAQTNSGNTIFNSTVGFNGTRPSPAFNANEGSQAGSAGFDDAPTLTAFTTPPANVTLALDVSRANTQNNGGNGSFNHVFTNEVRADIEVTYVYFTVPEPVSLSLFGLSLLGLGLARRVRVR